MSTSFFRGGTNSKNDIALRKAKTILTYLEQLRSAVSQRDMHTPEKGTVRVCEVAGGQLFRSIHFPEKVDPDTAIAEYYDGLLRVTASIAKPAAHKKLEITTS